MKILLMHLVSLYIRLTSKVVERVKKRAATISSMLSELELVESTKRESELLTNELLSTEEDKVKEEPFKGFICSYFSS